MVASLITSHGLWQNDRPGQEGNSDNQALYDWLLGRPTAPLNFADADGSVRSFVFDNRSLSSDEWVPAPGNMTHYTPRALVK